MTDSAQSEANASAALPLSVSARLGRLQFHLSGKFRVLQCADVQDGLRISQDTIRLIASACDAVRPDLVVLAETRLQVMKKYLQKLFSVDAGRNLPIFRLLIRSNWLIKCTNSLLS